MNDLSTRILELQQQAHDLLYLGMDDAPIYSDDFTRMNKSVLTQCDALFNSKGIHIEEEANLCLALLMGYNATIYDTGHKEKRKQVVLDRSFRVLEELPESLLKVRLLTYCYGEVYDEGVLKEVHSIIDSWNESSLTTEQMAAVKELRNMEENQYPVEEIE